MRDYQKDLEVCEKATEEPWTAEQMTSKKARRGGGYIYYKVVQAVNAICHYLTKKDADFIALARTALPWYIKRCMELVKQKANVLESYTQLKFTHDKMREIIQAIDDKEHGQYWAWQPDFEENHLESLSCPVLIPADWLRQLLEERGTQLQQAEALSKILRKTNKYLGKMCHGYIKRISDLQFQFQNAEVELEDCKAMNSADQKIIDFLNSQLQQAEESIIALIKAFDKWSEQSGWVNDEFDEFCGIIDSLRDSPSQPSRYQEALAVVEAARKDVTYHHKECGCETCQALTAYEKAGEGAGK